MGKLAIQPKQNLIPALQIRSRKSRGWDKREGEGEVVEQKV